jgi:uncharacterized small protein (DUF1192 family)
MHDVAASAVIERMEAMLKQKGDGKIAAGAQARRA